MNRVIRGFTNTVKDVLAVRLPTVAVKTYVVSESIAEQLTVDEPPKIGLSPQGCIARFVDRVIAPVALLGSKLTLNTGAVLASTGVVALNVVTCGR